MKIDIYDGKKYKSPIIPEGNEINKESKGSEGSKEGEGRKGNEGNKEDEEVREAKEGKGSGGSGESERQIRLPYGTKFPFQSFCFELLFKNILRA